MTDRIRKWLADLVKGWHVPAILAVVVLLNGCGCPTYNRRDEHGFYRVEVCPNQPPRVVCTAATKAEIEACKP